ncbi:putative reverse transcriptase domain-containing protein, partial [Tanacetum coccineum]
PYQAGLYGGSPRVIVYGYDGLPMQPVAPPSSDYVPGPEHPPSPVEVPYVPEPEYPEYLAPSDAEAPLEDQPLPADASPTALSPGYVADSYPDEDPKEDPEEDHADYPADGGDDDDEPSDDDDDETDDEDEDDDEEEEEHLALADSSDVPVVDPVPSAGDTEAFETDESAPTPRSPQTKVPFTQTRLRRARKTVILEPPMSPSMEARIAEYVVTPTPPSPPPSPLSPWSPPLPQIPSPPLPPPPSPHLPPHVPTSLPLPSSPLPPLPVLLFIPPPVDRREDIPETELPPRKRLCLTAPTLRYEVEESSTAAPRPTGGHRADYRFIGTTDAEIRRRRAKEVGYGIRDVWVDPIEAVEDVASTTLEGVNARVTELAAVQEQDTQDIYVVIEDTQDRQTQLFQRVDGLGQLSAALGQIQAIQARDQTHADDPEGAASTNNMPPRRSSGTARAAAAAARAATAADTPMTAAAVEQLIKVKVCTEGVVVLSQWFEKMESVFHISNCVVENQVKFATCTFLGNALTWWNSHIKIVTQDVAYAMDWKALKKKMTFKYCPRELALMCGRMFHEDSEEVEKYVGGLPDMIRGNVMSYQPKTMEKEIEFANDPMDQKVLTIIERQAEQKKKLEFNVGNNQGHQQQNKRQNTRRAYTVGPGEKREYTGSLPLCTKCNYHHKGPCAPRCNKCKKIGHLARDCRSSGPNGNNNNRRNFGTTQNVVTCYESGVHGHFKKDCPKLKNGNHGNQCGNGNAPAKVYVVGNAGTKPDSNVVTGTFLLNNRYAFILFDTGADRSFVSTTFSSLIDITPTT